MSHLFTTPTTGANAFCRDPRYENSVGVPNPNFITLTVKFVFNGLTDELEDTITYAKGSSMAVKNGEVRKLCNRLLQPTEPGANLLQADIEISGMPT